MGTIFIDECGYTGPDLLNADQPVFALGSLCLEESECRRLKQQFSGGVRSQELKHTSLAKRPAQRKMILDFLRYLDANQRLVKFAYVHKRFALIGKMVDLIIEPAAAQSGVNLYERGGNLALAHSLYYLSPKLVGQQRFDRLAHQFQQMVCRPSRSTYWALLEHAELLSTTFPDDEVLSMFALSLRRN